MKRLLLTLLTLAVMLSMLSVPALAGPSTAAEGVWQYKPTIEDVRMADGNMFLETSEEGLWTGTFEGESTEDGHVVVYRTGSWSFRGTVSFSQVTVDGASGTLEMTVVGSRPDAVTDWQGRWVILSGTGDLATLRGQGTWWGPGAPDVGQWGDIYYEGQIHFEP